MTLTSTKNHYHRATKKHLHNINWDIKRLKQRENFRIMKLETSVPLGLIQDLNWIHFMQTFRSPPLFFVSAYGLVKWSQISFSTCKSQIWLTLRTITAKTSWNRKLYFSVERWNRYERCLNELYFKQNAELNILNYKL